MVSLNVGLSREYTKKPVGQPDSEQASLNE